MNNDISDKICTAYDLLAARICQGSISFPKCLAKSEEIEKLR